MPAVTSRATPAERHKASYNPPAHAQAKTIRAMASKFWPLLDKLSPGLLATSSLEVSLQSGNKGDETPRRIPASRWCPHAGA